MSIESTTGEIVRALRDCLNVGCEECILHETEITPECKSHYCGAPTKLADRLESQEQTIAALTARAEQAERERDAAIKDMNGLCTRCKHWTCPNDDEPCLSCVNAETGNPNWTWRGLPQEGDGEE